MFSKIRRYVPILSDGPRIVFKHVFGPTRYRDEFEVRSPSLRGDSSHLQISVYKIADHPKSLKSLARRFDALNGVKFSGPPVLQVDQKSGDITIIPQTSGEQHTIRVKSNSEDNWVMISFDLTVARFLVPRGIALQGSRFVFPVKRGATEGGEFTIDSFPPEITAFGNRQYRLSLYNVVHRSYEYEAQLFDSVGIWYGEPELTIDQEGNLVLTGRNDGKAYRIHVHENRDPVEVIFNPM